MEMNPVANALSLAYSPHPLQPTLGREVLNIDWRIGETVQSLLERSGIDRNAMISVTWNDRLLSVDEWEVIIPQQGDVLQVCAEVAPGDPSVGKVTAQSPAGGTVANPAGTVTLTVAQDSSCGGPPPPPGP